jgi:hypothetical protein
MQDDAHTENHSWAHIKNQLNFADTFKERKSIQDKPKYFENIFLISGHFLPDRGTLTDHCSPTEQFQT